MASPLTPIFQQQINIDATVVQNVSIFTTDSSLTFVPQQFTFVLTAWSGSPIEGQPFITLGTSPGATDINPGLALGAVTTATTPLAQAAVFTVSGNFHTIDPSTTIYCNITTPSSAVMFEFSCTISGFYL